MRELSEQQRDRLAEALYEHREDALTCYDHSEAYCCVCGEHEVGGYRQHLADALAPVVAAIADEAAAGALRETAAAWTQGEWSNVMLPKPTPPAVPVIAYSNRVGDWLRERAYRIGGDA